MKHIYLSVVTVLLMALQAHAILTGEVTTTNPTCFNMCDGTVLTTVSGGIEPYTYAWDLPLTETVGDLTGLCTGSYSVTVTDNLGEQITLSFTLTVPELQVLGIVTPISCGNGADGSILTIVNGGTAPFMYNWAPLGATTPDLLGLVVGVYTVTVIDATGCMVTESFPVPDQSIAVTIETDGADPCTGPVGLTANVWGGTGSYLYNWSTGETTPSISTSGVSVVQVTVTDNGVCSTYATQYVPTVGGDLEYVVGGWLNRGFCRYLFPLVVNNSCATYTGAVTIEFDASVNVDAITPTPDAVVGNVAVWNSVTILSGEQFAVQAVVCVTLASACNDFVDVTITSDLGSDVLTPQILCSYDPNDKQVSPLGVGAEGFIENTEKLQYMVRFQNTGSVAATFIHVLDVLDADLDILSLNVVAASHAMELSISGDRTLDFFFDNINLPDSTSDLAGSSGFVIYEIDMLPGLSSGTEIENTASIYFDFNSPVITNTTLNTIAFPVGIQDVAAGNDAFTMYPNPTTGNVTIVRNGTAIYGLQVYDALGQLLHSVQGNKGTATVDISALPIGMYLLTLEDATGRYQSRLVKD